ncbi:Ureidoglycolate lyase [Streptomyces sp. YIM 130001]|uniref:fumarylacetoacetate hydrolase family protein n=1 Tax=Streptomyces sp. YIM 130001 TaxID=2259644 RepID=UPI000E64D0F5|nr:fumarylacetoacetate hydrolase family protein [Streptomyces sp. YIM 130001]RII17872.1 Ureidoglycolate lyase [Streptomyces sp. YIM 130001]
MRLASYLFEGTERWGFVVEPSDGTAWVIEPGRAEAFLTTYASIPSSGIVATRPRFLGDAWPGTLTEFLALEDTGLGELSRLVAHVERFVEQTDATLLPRAGHRVDEVELLAPVPRPRLYWGLVTNSPSFVRNRPNINNLNLFPLGHQRPQGAAIGPGEPVTMKHGHHLPHMAYNVELAVVIGKAGRDIPLDRAMDHVAGYTVVNDTSGSYYYRAVPGNIENGYGLPEQYNDWLYQATASWGGKKADTLSPMGPYLVTKDEVADPYNLLMYTRQSGRTRDRAHTAASLLGIERVIHWYTSFASLYPGDVIHFGTMGVDGLPVFPDDSADPGTRLEVEIEHVGTLVNPVRIVGGTARPRVPMESHPSYAIRELATSEARRVNAPDDWAVDSARHFYTSFGNDRVAREAAGLAELEVPRFLNGPASSLAASGSRVEVPARAGDIIVSIELAAVVAELAADVEDGRSVVLGYTPVVALCDLSFADAVVEPARAGERGITAVYGRWADGFNIVGEHLVALDAHDWRERAMTLTIGDRVVHGTTSQYVAGPEELVTTISSMITLFPGDVITLGATATRLRISREEYEHGLVVGGEIEGLGTVQALLSPRNQQS